MEAEVTRKFLKKQAGMIKELEGPGINEIADCLLTLSFRGGFNINDSIVECWRYCRNLPALDHLKARILPRDQMVKKFRYCEDQTSFTKPIKVKFAKSGELRADVSRFENLLSSEEYNVIPSIINHLHLPGGVWSCDGLLWSSIPMNFKGRVMVIGTGAGGIQTLLSSRGIINVGCDVREAVPISLIGKSIYIPPELLRYNPSLSSICRETELTNLRLTSRESISLLLQRYSPEVVIFDAEPKGYHIGTDIINVIISCGFRGVLYIKFWLTHCEFLNLSSAIESSENISSIEWYLLTRSEPTDDCYSAIVLKCSVAHNSRLIYPSRVTAEVESWGEKLDPLPTFDRDREYKALIRYITGSIADDLRFIKGGSIRVRYLLSSSRTDERSPLTGSLYMQMVASICYLELFECMRDKKDDEIAEVLKDVLDKGQIVTIGDKRHRITSARPQFREMITRVIPRLIALHRLMQADDKRKRQK
jgi:hypothetical protein